MYSFKVLGRRILRAAYQVELGRDCRDKVKRLAGRRRRQTLVRSNREDRVRAARLVVHERASDGTRHASHVQHALHLAQRRGDDLLGTRDHNGPVGLFADGESLRGSRVEEVANFLVVNLEVGCSYLSQALCYGSNEL